MSLQSSKERNQTVIPCYFGFVPFCVKVVPFDTNTQEDPVERKNANEVQIIADYNYFQMWVKHCNITNIVETLEEMGSDATSITWIPVSSMDRIRLKTYGSGYYNQEEMISYSRKMMLFNRFHQHLTERSSVGPHNDLELLTAVPAVALQTTMTPALLLMQENQKCIVNSTTEMQNLTALLTQALVDPWSTEFQIPEYPHVVFDQNLSGIIFKYLGRRIKHESESRRGRGKRPIWQRQEFRSNVLIHLPLNTKDDLRWIRLDLCSCKHCQSFDRSCERMAKG
jgi:hypothetical protein